MIRWTEEKGGYRACLRHAGVAFLVACTGIACLAVSIPQAIDSRVPSDFTMGLGVLAAFGVFLMLAAVGVWRSTSCVFVTLDGKAFWTGDLTRDPPMEPVVVNRFALEFVPEGRSTPMGYRIAAILPNGTMRLPLPDWWELHPQQFARLVRQLNNLVGADPRITEVELAHVLEDSRRVNYGTPFRIILCVATTALLYSSFQLLRIHVW